ncbi:Domain of uncharacterised function (DUF3330) [Citrobacter werkmanii]|uniref:Domain of uncharacterized function (DUF3330) n=2 Tax=Pseudomonadota TaxID=1224 RepID=A0ABN7HBU4_9ENTR|nr:Domain of uncharacterised function (DUF3330) [Citrobacter werkmanii]
MNANAPNTASCTTCCVCCKEIPLDAAFTPEGAEYVEHFCGLDCYERFRARAKAATESDIAPVPAVRSRQIEAYPNLMSDAMCHFQKTTAPVDWA